MSHADDMIAADLDRRLRWGDRRPASCPHCGGSIAGVCEYDQPWCGRRLKARGTGWYSTRGSSHTDCDGTGGSLSAQGYPWPKDLAPHHARYVEVRS